MKIVRTEDGQWEVIGASGRVLSQRPFASYAAAEAWSKTIDPVELEKALEALEALEALKASARAGTTATKDEDDKDDGGGSSPPPEGSRRP